MKIKKKLLKLVAPMATKEMRMILARAGEQMSPGDLVTVIFILMLDKDPDVSDLAKKTFKSLPLEVLTVALSSEVEPQVISALLEEYPGDESLQDLACYNKMTDDQTLIKLAATGPLSVIAILSSSSRLRGNDELFQALKSNQLTLKPVLKMAEERFKSKSEKGAEEEEEEIIDDLTDEDLEESDADDKENLYKLIQRLSVPQKIKLAITGNKEARSILLKERNKVVTRCVVSNPRISEDEVISIAASKGTSDETLRQIARKDEWLKNYQVKKALVINPKTPFFISARLIPRLNEKDLRAISKSKNVTNNVSGVARRIVDKKKS